MIHQGFINAGPMLIAVFITEMVILHKYVYLLLWLLLPFETKICNKVRTKPNLTGLANNNNNLLMSKFHSFNNCYISSLEVEVL